LSPLIPNWSTESTEVSKASRQQVWSMWEDGAGWASWNPTIAEGAMDGPIAEGTTGRVTHVKGRKSTYVIRDVTPGAGFTAESVLPAAHLRIEHEVSDEPGGGSRVTQRAVLVGPLGRMWSLMLGRELKHDMAAAVGAMVRVAAERGDAAPRSASPGAAQ
jgi:uncharacterized protein YndB with AHSA1/START domain